MLLSTRLLVVFIYLGVTQAVIFNGTTFHEEYVCEADGRIAGVCEENSKCKPPASGQGDCGVQGSKLVCCSSETSSASTTGSKSRAKCAEYSKIDHVSECPTFRPFSGDNEVVPGEHPYSVALGYRNRDKPEEEVMWLCAGSLISERYVLTTDVCIQSNKKFSRQRFQGEELRGHHIKLQESMCRGCIRRPRQQFSERIHQQEEERRKTANQRICLLTQLTDKDREKCACWRLTIEGATSLPSATEAPHIGYMYKRLYNMVATGIYECNSHCKCSNSCMNRVVQFPLELRLKIFKTKKRGFGIYCLNDIPEGSFICTYVGLLLTEQGGSEGGITYGDEYLADLDFIEVVEQLKEGYERDVMEQDNVTFSIPTEDTISNWKGAKKIEKKRSPCKTSSDDSSQESDSELHCRAPSSFSAVSDATSEMESTNKQLSLRKLFGAEECSYLMDTKSSGNIGRYLNHSCSPNIFVQNVFVDTHDLRFPWVAFFAMSDIQAGTELTWDYNYEVGSVPGKILYCYCDSSECRGRLL